MPVSLTDIEMRAAAMVGAERETQARQRGLRHRAGADPDNGWTNHIEGAAGEIAVAKALNRYWAMPVNTYRHGGDVGPHQVRTSTRHDNSLIIRPTDRDDDVFILVTGRMPSFQIHGFILGGHAKQQRWLRAPGNRPSAYFVPRSALHPIARLAEIENAATNLNLTSRARAS